MPAAAFAINQESPPSKTGRSYIYAMHSIAEGDVVRWNDRWHTVQVVVRTPDAPQHRQVTIHTNLGTLTGGEQQPITVVPRAFVVQEV